MTDNEKVGVVFQITSEGILFEMSELDEAIGVVKATDVFISDGQKIPENETSVDLISRYIQVGCELKVKVEQKDDLKMIKYTEQEDEVDEKGNLKKISKKSEVQPKYLATSARLVSDEDDANNTQDESGKVFEEQIGDMLDYEEDVIFLEDEDIDILDEEKRKQDGFFDEKETPKKTSENTPQSNKQTASKPEMKTGTTKITVQSANKDVAAKTVVVKEQTFFAKAVIVQLKKPGKGTEIGKVQVAIVEINDGKFAGKKVSVANGCMYAWGHSLGQSNLMYVLKYHDECEVEYRVAELKRTDENDDSQSDDSVESPVIKYLWIGGKVNTPVKPDEDQAMKEWLSERETSHEDFMKWISGQLPPKPYFPFISDVYKTSVVGFLKTENFSAQGVFLRIGEVICKADGSDGGSKVIRLNPIPKPVPIDQPDFELDSNARVEKEKSSSEVALLMHDDFYVCGVSTGFMDLRLLLRLGEEVSCQIEPISTSDKRRLKTELAQFSGGTVSHLAYLGYVGPKRPKQANLSSTYAPFLDKYLESKGLSVQEFDTLRTTSTRTPSNLPPSGSLTPFVPTTGFMNMPPPSMMSLGGLAPPGMPPPPHLISVPMRPPPYGAIPGVVGPFIPQVPLPHITTATNIAARAANIMSPDDLRVRSLIHTPLEIEVAARIIQILSSALISKMQLSISSKLGPNVPSAEDLRKTSLQAQVAQQVLLQPGSENAPPNSGSKGLSSQYNEVLRKLEKDSHAASKVNENLGKEASPLELLRDFIINQKPIKLDANNIWFGDVCYSKSCKTNFKSSLGDQYYTLESLYYFHKTNAHRMSYGSYHSAAEKEKVPPVKFPDRDAVHKYLTTNCDPPPNVVSMSHKELNPHLFVKQTITEWKNKYVTQGHKRANSVPAQDPSSKLSKMNEKDLLSEAHRQLQGRQQAKISRFDQAPAMVPGVPPPGVVIPTINPALKQSQSSQLNPTFQLNPAMKQQINPAFQQRWSESADPARRSPTFERMQEVQRRSRSPSFRNDRDSTSREREFTKKTLPAGTFDPFHPSTSPPQSRKQLVNAADPFRAVATDPFHPAGLSTDPFRAAAPASAPATDDRLRKNQSELEQKRLWEEYKRERDAKKKIEMERLRDEEMLRARNAEMEREREKRLSEEARWKEDIERQRRLRHENDDIRQRKLEEEQRGLPPPPKIAPRNTNNDLGYPAARPAGFGQEEGGHVRAPWSHQSDNSRNLQGISPWSKSQEQPNIMNPFYTGKF